MGIPAEEVELLIRAEIPDAHVKITDLAGDNNHYHAEITSARFSGKTKLQQHQMVYAALGARMGTELHALSLKTIAKISDN